MCIKKLNHVYHGMKERCYYTKNKEYKNYGGRGITVCDEWLNPQRVGQHQQTKGWLTFRDWAIQNGYKEGLTLDRVDVNKGYSPDNCRWVSRKVQTNNTTQNRYITYRGETKSLSQWCDELGLKYHRVKDRLNKLHWSVEKAFELPKAKGEGVVRGNVWQKEIMLS